MVDQLWLHLNKIKAVFNKDGTTTLHSPGHPSHTYPDKVSFDNAANMYKDRIEKTKQTLKELGYG